MPAGAQSPDGHTQVEDGEGEADRERELAGQRGRDVAAVDRERPVEEEHGGAASLDPPAGRARGDAGRHFCSRRRGRRGVGRCHRAAGRDRANGSRGGGVHACLSVHSGATLRRKIAHQGHANTPTRAMHAHQGHAHQGHALHDGPLVQPDTHRSHRSEFGHARLGLGSGWSRRSLSLKQCHAKYLRRVTGRFRSRGGAVLQIRFRSGAARVPVQLRSVQGEPGWPTGGSLRLERHTNRHDQRAGWRDLGNPDRLERPNTAQSAGTAISKPCNERSD